MNPILLVPPSEREARAGLVRSPCNPNCNVDITVMPGMDGCRITVDFMEVRHGLKPSEAMEALHEARRLAMVSAHEALAMLAACLAHAPHSSPRD